MTQQPAPPSFWLKVNLIGQIAFGLLAMTICLPSMLDWARTFQTSQATVQLTFSGFIATYGGLQLVHGPLSDRFGRKPVLMAGLAMSLAGSVMAALAGNVGWLIFARLVQGAGGAAGMVVGRALVQDLFQPSQRTRMMAFVGMMLGLCPPAATVLGGFIHVRWGWQLNFVVMAVVAFVLLVSAWRGLPSGRLGAARAGGGLAALWRSYLELARLPAFVSAVGVLSMATATFYVFLAGAPLVLAGYGITPDRVGFYLMTPPLAYIVGNMLTLRLVRFRSDRWIMRTGQFSALSGLLLTAVIGATDRGGPLAFSLPLLLLGFGHGLLVPPALAATVGLVPALAGTAAAVAGLMQQVGGALGGYVVGWLPRQETFELSLLMLACSSIGGLFFLWWYRVQASGEKKLKVGLETRTAVPPSS